MLLPVTIPAGELTFNFERMAKSQYIQVAIIVHNRNTESLLLDICVSGVSIGILKFEVSCHFIVIDTIMNIQIIAHSVII